MQTNSLPLISVATLKAALAQLPPAQATGSSSAPIEQQAFTAQVLHSQSQPSIYLLTLQAGKAQLQVQSQLPLPKGTELHLALVQDTNTAQPKLNVLEIILPRPSLPPKLPPSGTLEALLKPFISARLPLLQNSAPVAPMPNDTYQLQTPGANTAKPSQIDTASTLLQAAPLSQTRANGQAPIPRQSANPALLELFNRLNTLTASTLTAKAPSLHSTPTWPAGITQTLNQWQSSLPRLADLAQPAALKQSFLHSGLSYERQILQLLTSHTAPTPTTSVLFKQLWAKAAQPSSGQTATTVQGSPTLISTQTATEALASTTGAVLPQLLSQLKSKLNQALQHRSPPPTAQLPSLLQALLSQDLKAVLSRALLSWAKYLAANTQGIEPKLPLTPNPMPQAPEGLRLIQSALASIEHEQARQLLQQTHQPMSVNLPIYYQDQGTVREFKIHIEHDAQKTGTRSVQKQRLWHLRLYFDLQQLGPLDIDLELQMPKLKATFWSKQSQTLTQLNQALQPLRQNLANLGVEVEELQVRHGQLPEPSRNHISQRLVDIHG